MLLVSRDKSKVAMPMIATKDSDKRVMGVIGNEALGLLMDLALSHTSQLPQNACDLYLTIYKHVRIQVIRVEDQIILHWCMTMTLPLHVHYT